MDCISFFNLSDFDYVHLTDDEFAALVDVCGDIQLVTAAAVFSVGSGIGGVYTVGAGRAAVQPVGAVVGRVR